MDQTVPPHTDPAQIEHEPRRRFRVAPAGVGLVVLIIITAACLGSLPWTLAGVTEGGSPVPRYNSGNPQASRLPPMWWPHSDGDIRRAIAAIPKVTRRELAVEIAPDLGMEPEAVLTLEPADGEAYEAFHERLARERPRFLLGTDLLGRSVFVRALTGGGISLGIGIAAALISVSIGTIYGAVAGYAGGMTDSVMMRVVDVLYGLPYILLVVLLAVASDALVDEYVTRSRERADWIVEQARLLPDAPAESGRLAVETWLNENLETKAEIQDRALRAVPPRQVSQSTRSALDVATLLAAIGGVSWLTLARVIRGQVLSLKNQPFVEAARAAGAHPMRIFTRHLLPNLVGPIVVYVTLTVPQAILQESFLSFLGIGVKPPLPSWGNLAADGLNEVNPYRSHWWLLAVPSFLLGVTLLALNFVGEGLRERLDPRHTLGR